MAREYEHTLPVLVSVGGDEIELRATLTYTLRPGRSATGPSYASGGEPAEPAEVEITGMSLEIPKFGGLVAGKPDYTPVGMPTWLGDWLSNSDEVYSALGEAASWGEDDAGDEADYRYEAMKDSNRG